MPLRSQLPLSHDTSGEFHQVCGFAGQHQPSCLQVGHIQQIFGEFTQALGSLIDLAQSFALPLGKMPSFMM